MSKQFLGVIAAIVLIFAGIAVFSGNKSSDGGTSSSSSASPTSHVIGKGTTGVKLVEYGDYQCPFCGTYYPVLKQVTAEFGDQIKFQFRNFPLQSIHRNAFAAARAAEAAGLQNKYWEMHDKLYENQNAWSESSSPSGIFEGYAKQLGLNVEQFKRDFASDKVNAAINADLAEAGKLKITGTPTFFIDGKQIQIGQTFADFEKVIKSEIAKKGSANSAGTTNQSTAPADKP